VFERLKVPGLAVCTKYTEPVEGRPVAGQLVMATGEGVPADFPVIIKPFDVPPDANENGWFVLVA
jgi:hypothetical protein